jgi:sulfur-carrier protein
MPINNRQAAKRRLIRVHLTGQLRDLTKGRAQVELESAVDVKTMILKLDSRYPGMGQRILDDQEKIRPHVNIFVNSENSRELQLENTKLKNNDIIHILPSVAGG